MREDWNGPTYDGPIPDEPTPVHLSTAEHRKQLHDKLARKTFLGTGDDDDSG